MESGVGMEDLPDVFRAAYLHSVESARAVHDPAADWEGFREYLWEALVGAFALGAGGADLQESCAAWLRPAPARSKVE